MKKGAGSFTSQLSKKKMRKNEPKPVFSQLLLLAQQTPSILASPSVKEKLMSRRFYVAQASLTLFLVCVSQWDRATASEEKEHTIHTIPLRLHNQPVQRRSTGPTQVPPLAASASNPDSKHLNGTKPTLGAGTTSYSSSETKPLLDRSAIQIKKIPALEMKKLILEQQFFNDVHYKVEGDLSLTDCTCMMALPENLSVEGDLTLRGCTGLTALPENLSVGRNFFLSGCTDLTALPENLSVLRGLYFKDCTGLSALPESFSVESYLYLIDCTGLTALPENLSVRGDLSLNGCTGLTALPENLSVGDGLSLDGCTGLTALPDNLSVESCLSLKGCTGLTALPENLSVGGIFFLRGCTGLTVLPENLSVGDDFYLSHCTGLTALPENLSVGRDFFLRGCIGLTALPENLSVGRDFFLRGCTGLTVLPENLPVRGSLSLDGCTGLRALPENLSVGGNLYLLHCTGLTALTNGIAMLGLTSQGYTRHVYLENTRLSDALIDRLRIVEAPGMCFHFYRNAGQPEQVFLNIEQALAFWQNLAPSSVETPVLSLRSDQAADLIYFLGRLTGTADYKNQASRPVLAQRVTDVMTLLAGSVRVRDDALVRIHHAISTCDDRVILALDDLDTLQLLTSAETMAVRDSNPSELRALGLKMMRLDEVKRIARDHMKTLNWVDDIEVELAFQIGVRKHLDLPGSTQNMIFRDCAQVSEQDIAKAVEQVKENCSEAHLNVYLDRWAPWQKYQRHQSMPTFDQLKSKMIACINDCTICGEKTNRMVELGDCHLDYDALRKAYLEKGKNPLTNTPMDWSIVVRLIE